MEADLTAPLQSPAPTRLPPDESETRVRQVLDTLPAAAYTCNGAGLITYFNQQAIEAWGRTPKLYDPADRYCGSFRLFRADGSPIPHDDCWMAVAIREERTISGGEVVVERPDGTRRSVLAYASPLRSFDGKVVGGVNILIDITDHRKSTEALRRREAVLAQAGQIAHFGAWDIEIVDHDDINANPLRWSDEASRVFGFEPGAVQPTNELFFSIVHPDDRQRIVDAVARSRAERRPYEVEHRIRRPDGVDRVVLEHAEWTFGDDGRPRRLIGAVQDITERKRAEEALRRSEQNYVRLLNSIDGIVWEADVRTMAFTFVSSQAERLLGYPISRWLDDPNFWRDHLHPDDCDATINYCLDFTRRGETHAFDYRMIAADGRIVWLHDVVTVDMQHGVPVTIRGVMVDITERKQAEEALRQSEQRHEALINAVPDLMFLLDRDGVYLDCQASNADDLFISPALFLGKRVYDVMPAELAQTIMQALADVERTGDTTTFEYALPLRSGTRWFEARVTPCGPNRFLAMARDITERIRMVAALHESEERLRLVARATLDAYYDWDLRTNRVWRNEGYQKLLGYEDPVGPDLDWIIRRIHPEDCDGVFASVETAFRNRDTVWQREYRLLRHDGGIVHVLDRGCIEYDESGTPVRFLGAFTDLSESKRIAAALEQQRLRMEGIVNSAMDGIITIDEEQRIVVFNAAAERMFRIPAEAAIGRSIERFLPERYRAVHREHVRRFGETGVTTRAMGQFGTISGLRADGEEFPIEASISQIELEGRKLFTVTCRDVTERVRSDEMRQKLETRLVQAQKMEAVGQLAGGVAHDFNNLLTIIAGYVDLLQSSLPADSPLQSSVQAIHEAGERAASLTGQLLSFSRRAVLEPRVLDLNAVVRDTEKMLARVLGADILLATSLEAGIGRVKVDPGQLGQVLLNLAVNARDAMPTGGRLTIETANVRIDDETARLHPDIDPGPYVLMAISDTGHGMNIDVRSRIFEPFFTTKDVGKGTGLGLAVVHGIVSQSGGFIDVITEPSIGTTFHIYLPAVELPVSAPAENHPTGNLRGSETILLVEDETAVRRLAQLALVAHGYQVLVAADGDAALDIVHDHRGRIDLVLTDVVMPRRHGPELVNALRPRAPHLKVLYTSGYTDDAVLRYGLTLETVAFLQKPYTPVALVRKVRQVLDQM